MSLELALRDLGAWSVQVAVLALVAAAAARMLPIERPAARLALGQALLAASLLLPLLQPWHTASASVRWSTALAAAGVTGRAASAHGAAPGAEPGWPALLALALGIGSLVQLGRVALGLARLRALARTGRPCEPPRWLDALRLEVAPRASFVVSDGTVGPATFGLRRPTVLLPALFARLGRDQQQAIALHELLHVRRADWLAQLVEELLRAVLFFHPAVHWLVDRVRLAREQTVDAEVVRRLGGRDAYLDSLVAVARAASHARAVPAAPFLGESHLRERVDQLLKEISMSRARSIVHGAATTAAVVLALSWAAAAVPLQAAQPASPAATVSIEDKTDVRDLKLVHQARPAYPPAAKTEKVEGVFVIDVVIATDGSIRDARVVASAPTVDRLKAVQAQKGSPAGIEGDPRLANAALEAVKQWRYLPIVREGKAVEARATVTIRFALS